MTPFQIPRFGLFTACLLVGLLAQVPPAHAADCNVVLKKTDGYRQLSTKLQCLQNRIRTLERLVDAKEAALGRDRVAKLKQGIASGRSIEKNGVIIALKKCAWSQQNGGLYCEYSLTNTTRKDKKQCFGQEPRLVTDTGESFSGRYYVSVASKGSHRRVCDTLLPLVRATGWIRFSRTKGAANEKVQLIRLDCGPGCTLDAYDVPIE